MLFQCYINDEELNEYTHSYIQLATTKYIIIFIIKIEIRNTLHAVEMLYSLYYQEYIYSIRFHQFLTANAITVSKWLR